MSARSSSQEQKTTSSSPLDTIKKMKEYFRFRGEIVDLPIGRYHYTVIYLPEKIAQEMVSIGKPKVRMEGELNGEPLTGAWQLSRGKWFLMLSKSVLKNAELILGDTAQLEFRVSDQNEVVTPLELLEAIQSNRRYKVAWEKLTVGNRRALAHRVLSAKTESTRLRRIQEILRLFTENKIITTQTIREKLTRKR